MFLLTHFLISFAWMQIKRNLAFRDNIDEIHFLSPLWLPPLSHSSIPPSVDFSIFPHVYPPSFPLFPPPCLASSQSLLCILAVTEVKHRQERKCIKKMHFKFKSRVTGSKHGGRPTERLPPWFWHSEVVVLPSELSHSKIYYILDECCRFCWIVTHIKGYDGTLGYKWAFFMSMSVLAFWFWEPGSPAHQ